MNLEIINLICQAGTLKKSFELYEKYMAHLKGWVFIFPSYHGSTVGFSVNRSFSGRGRVRGLFSTPNAFILDETIYHGMKNHQQIIFPIDYSVSLDNQATSYIESYINGNLSKTPIDLYEAIEFITRPEVNIDPVPYLIENLFNLNQENNIDKIFNKIKAYEILRYIDRDYFLKNKKICSVLSEEELNSSSSKFISTMLHDLSSPAFQELNTQINAYYALLLKMSIIHFTSKKSADTKIYEFLKFTDEHISTLFLRESIFARMFFEKGNSLAFFYKVQLNTTNLLPVLKGMAWDFHHIRSMERICSSNIFSEAQYFFPSILTFDASLSELIDLCPLKAIAYNKTSFQFQPFFDQQLVESINPRKYNKELNQMYFNLEDKDKKLRDQRRQFAKKNLHLLVENLEKEVLWIINKHRKKT